MCQQDAPGGFNRELQLAARNRIFSSEGAHTELDIDQIMRAKLGNTNTHWHTVAAAHVSAFSREGLDVRNQVSAKRLSVVERNDRRDLWVEGRRAGS